ncbi:MAG: hypothetical protein GW809_09135 [Bacteroidetes bacterium]|nr:hypothetical protein [Bacteroidota bacterium]
MRIFFITVLIFHFILFACGKSTVPFSTYEENIANTNNHYEIYKIDSLNIYYIIYAKRNHNKFKILSKKDSTDIPCDKVIRVGAAYDLELKSILQQEIHIDDKIISSGNNLLVNCFIFEHNTRICREEDINDLHYALNIKGLCLIEN